MRTSLTAPIVAAAFISSYAVVVATGSRALGGLVLAAGGLWCLRRWTVEHDLRTAVVLGAVGLLAFVLSHVLALAIGAWPAVLAVAAATSAIVWVRADAR